MSSILSSQSLSSRSRSQSKQRKGLTLHHQLSSSSNNPQSSCKNTSIHRSISPNGFQLYKHCVDQIHRQPLIAQVRSETKIQTPPQVIRHQPIIIKTSSDFGVQINQSFCSIEQNIKGLKESINSNKGQEQIDIVVNLYENKIKQMQQIYQKQILQLEIKLHTIQSSIRTKQEQIDRMKQFYELRLSQERQNRLQSQFKPVLQTREQYNVMKQTVSYLIKQSKDIDRKIKLIVSTNNKQIDNDLLKKLQVRIDRICNEVIIGYGQQLGAVKIKYEQVKQLYQQQFNKQQSLLQKINDQFENLKKQNNKMCDLINIRQKSQVINKNNSMNNNKQQCDRLNQRIMQIREQLTSYQLSLKSIPDIFKMYNIQYQQLFKQIKDNIEQLKEKQEEENNQKILTIQQPVCVQQKQYLQPQIYSQISIDVTPTPVSHKTQSLINSPKQEIRPLFRSSFNNTASMFSSTITSRNLSNTYKIQKLIETFNVLAQKLPVKCQTDQTGYLKYSDSGTYIFDKNGNLFEFNRQQFETAIGLGLLVIQN